MRRSVIPFLGLLALSSTACGLLDREFTIKKTINVHGAATDPLCQSDAKRFDLREDKAFNDLKGTIGSITLKKVVVRIANPKTSDESVATLANGELNVSAEEAGESLRIGTYTDLAISEGSSQEIPFDSAAADRISALALSNESTFFVQARGCVNAVPAFFDLALELTLQGSL